MSKSKTSQETLTRIVSLLHHELADRRAAAAIVIAELAPGDTHTLEALRKALTRADDPELRKHAATALGEIAPSTIVNDLRPLLKDPVAEVRETAKRVLASGRGVTAEDVARMLESSDERQRVSAIAVLGAMGSAQARRSIITQLADGSPRIYEAVREAMVPLLEALDSELAEAEAAELSSAMDRARYVKDEKLGITLVHLFDALSSEGAVPALLDIAASPAKESVRAAAIEALRRATHSRKCGHRIFGALLELLEDSSTPHGLFAPITGTLSVLDVPLALEPRVRNCLTVDDPTVRRWALKALGRLDSAPAGKALAEAVAHGDATDREVALAAAVATTSGKNALARLLGKLKDPARAEIVAAGLRPHLDSLPQTTLHHLEEAALEASPEVAGVVMNLLKRSGSSNAGRAHDGLFDKALKLKRDGRFYDAADIFKRMAAGNTDAESRYQLGVCELMVSKRKVARGTNTDPCLSTLGGLQRVRDFPLVDRLKKEPGVGEEELYYLGFSLAEGNEDEQGLGGDLLLVIAESESASKLPQMAKNKLMTMGWLE